MKGRFNFAPSVRKGQDENQEAEAMGKQTLFLYVEEFLLAPEGSEFPVTGHFALKQGNTFRRYCKSDSSTPWEVWEKFKVSYNCINKKWKWKNNEN